MRKENEVVDTERMVLMKVRVIASMLLVAVGLCLSTAQASNPYTGIVSIDSVDAHPGQSAVVPIRLTNSNIPLAGVFVPVKFDTTLLTLDSVSFESSLLAASMTGAAFVDAPNQTVEVRYVPSVTEFPLPVISTASGVIARMYFHVALGTPNGYVPLDSANRETHYGSAVAYTRVEVYDNTGDSAGTFFPGFTPGGINVLVPTGVNDGNGSSLPHEFALLQNYPNPFNPSTVIRFSLPVASHVKMEVFNILGQNVTTLLDENMAAGNHQVNFDASSYPSGIYFYRWTHMGGSETRKMILVK